MLEIAVANNFWALAPALGNRLWGTEISCANLIPMIRDQRSRRSREMILPSIERNAYLLVDACITTAKIRGIDVLFGWGVIRIRQYSRCSVSISQQSASPPLKVPS